MLARGSFLAFIVQGAGVVLLFFAEVVAARVLGVREFGIYALVVAWLYFLGVIGTLGFNHALLRFVPIYLANEDWGGLRGVLGYASRRAVAGACCIAVCGFAILYALSACCLTPAVTRAFIPALVALPFLVLSSLRQATLRGINKIASALVPDFIFRPALLIMLLIALPGLSARSVDATSALFLSLVAAMTVFLVGNSWLRRLLPPATLISPPRVNGTEWSKTAFSMLLIAGFNVISSRTDTIMLGFLTDTQNVGIYSAASRIADVIVFGLVSANAIVAPMIASLHAQGKHEELQHMIKQAAYGVFVFTVPLALVVILLGQELLTLFGPEFTAGYGALTILSLGQVVNALIGPVGFLMTMTGHHREAVRIVGVSALLNLVLNALLIPMFGMTGAALATATSTAIWNLAMYRFVRRNLAIESFPFRLFDK